MSNEWNPLVLVHGFSHGSWCWSEVTAHLAGAGHPAVAVDLAGHGLRAAWPRCLSQRPFDPAAVATEVSPVAGIDLDQAAELLTGQVKQIGGGRPLTVVAHSMSGAVLTRVAQQAPGLVARAVYLSAVMPASGIPAGAYLAEPENAGELISPSVRADPHVVGAFRIDVASGDPAYRAQLRRAFYGDVDPVVAEAALALLTPDAPAGIALGATVLTEDGWGSVPRTYIGCTQDMAVRPGLQRRLIREADTAFPGNPTSVATLDSSHSPFLSMPDQLADLLAHLPARSGQA